MSRSTTYRREAAAPAPGAKPTWRVVKTNRTTEEIEGTYPTGMKESQVMEFLAPAGSLGGRFTDFRNGCFSFLRNTD